MITAILCVLIVFGVGAMIVLPQLEDRNHRKRFPALLAIIVPVLFILVMVFAIIKVNSGK